MIIHLYSIAELAVVRISNQGYVLSNNLGSHRSLITMLKWKKQRMGSVCLQYVMLNAFMVTYRLGI